MSDKIAPVRIVKEASVSSGIINDLFSGFEAQYPGIIISTATSHHGNPLGWLLKDECDFVLTHAPNTFPGLSSIKMLTEPLMLVVQEKYPAAFFNQVDLEQLRQEKLLLPAIDIHSVYSHKVSQLLKAYQIYPHTFLDTRLEITIPTLVSQGLGISILPQSFAYAEANSCRFIKLPYEMELYLTRKKDNKDWATEQVLRWLFF